MTVQIRPLNTLGAAVNRFDYWEDEFGLSVPAQTISEVRLNYTHFGTTTETSAIGVNNGFRLQGTAVGASFFCSWIPIAVPGLLNKNQFAEFVLLATIGAAPRAGLCLFSTSDNIAIPAAGGGNSHLYFLATRPDAAVLDVQRVTNGVITNLDVTTPFPAINDKIGFTAEINPADVTLKVYINEVLTTTVVDANAARFSTGLPGMVGRQNTVVGIEFGSLRIGPLNRLGY